MFFYLLIFFKHTSIIKLKNMIKKEKRLITPEVVLKASVASLIFYPIIIFLFLWRETFTISEQVNHSKLGTLGDMLGGTLGPIWSLAGIILFYIALKEQRDDLKVNKDALLKQGEALKLQADEFRLQREEMGHARKVSSEQAKTLQQQRIESTYFSLLDLYHKITVDLNNSIDGKNFFKEFKGSMDLVIDSDLCMKQKHQRAVEHYLSRFSSRKEELSHYFRIVYRIIRIIEESNIGVEEKFKYVKIIRSRLSQNELFAIYYNSFTPDGIGFYKLVLSFNLLKHLTPLSKLEFREYRTRSFKEDEANIFVSELRKSLASYFNNLRCFLKTEFEGDYKESFRVGISNSFIIVYATNDENRLTMKIKFDSNEKSVVPIGLSKQLFSKFVKELLYDQLIVSNYINDLEFDDFVTDKSNDESLIYDINSDIKLNITSDLT